MTDYSFANVHSLKMALRNDDPGISKVLKKPLLNKKWHREPEFMSILEEYLRPHDIFFDLGCNIGYVSLFVLKNISKKGYLYAIDPDKENISALKKSLENNNLSNNYSIKNIALSSQDGEIAFEFSNESNLHKINKDLSPQANNFRKINCRSFDSYFSDKKLPTFIKMDVEGAEIDILFGMKNFLNSSNKCKILMELHPTLYKPNEYKKAFKLLFSNGFRLEKFVGSSRAHYHPILKNKYIPSKIYRSGPFSRAVIDNLNEDDFHALNLNKQPFKTRLNFHFYLLHPKKIFKPFIKSTKLSRAALFIR